MFGDRSYLLFTLEASKEKDKHELIDFIKSITHSTGKSDDKWSGKRDMVDLWVLVKRYFYHPLTNGSNSIKQVLPAVLNESKILQKKYSKPIYGTKEIESLNFTNHKWIEFKKDKTVVDPYKSLKPVFDEVKDEYLVQFLTDDTLSDGGAAMMAYAKMQFSEMSEIERKHVKEALLRYCELDTMAMVFIIEYFLSVIK